MATYAIDFYGRAKYGTATGVLYDANPFFANEYQFGRLLLNWVTPQGDWTLFRLVKNLSGFAALPDNGTILIDINKDIDGAPPNQYDDLDCIPGNFYYYTIFVGVGSSDPQIATWWRAGNAMNIATEDYQWTTQLWSWIPRIYQRGDNSTVITDELDDENETLKRFLDIFGYQLDVLSTSGLALNKINDVSNVSYQAIPSLGAQFGVTVEPELGPRIARSRISNATYINKTKGTEVGLQALISSATGWDADVTYGKNMLLNSDQSSFVHPIYNQWNGAVNYAIGERVVYNSNIYQANVGNYNQPPATTRTNNTQWNYVGDTATNLENPITRGQSTWGMFYFTPAYWHIDPTSAGVRTSVGFQSTTDSTVYYSNALVVTNRSGVTTDILVSMTAPISATAWSSTTTYVLNNYVTYNGANWRSLAANNKNNIPGTHSPWWKQSYKVVNTAIDSQQGIQDSAPINLADKGKTFTASAYVMNHAIAGTSTPSLARVIIQWYDDYGQPAGYAYKPPSTFAFDNFATGAPGSDISSVAATDGSTWSAAAAIDRSGLGYVYRNTTTNGYTISLNSVTRATGWVGTTVLRFATVGGSGAAGNGLIFRYSDASNYFRLGKTKLEVVNAGVASTLIDLTTTPLGAFTDGDRMYVYMTGSNISVYKNLTYPTSNRVWIGTSTFNQTATRIGIWVGY